MSLLRSSSMSLNRLTPRAASRGRLPAPNARTTGLLLVGLVHVLMVGALVKGFQRHASEAPPPIQVRAIPEPPIQPPEPLTRDLIDPPPQHLPKTVEVPIPLVDIQPQTPPVIRTEAATEPATDRPFQVTADKGSEPVVGTKPPAREAVTSPGLVCTAMAAPDLPAVNWSGEALFRAVADVQGGRVVAVQIQALGGTMDLRTRRQLSNAIEGTLKSRYICPGDHRFQQDFAFKVD